MVDRADELAAENRFLTLCRIGFLGRGLLYILIAGLALGTGRTEDLTGALEYLGRGSGRLLLIGVTAGMAAYGTWRLADAAFGLEKSGTGGAAMRRRAAVAVIGCVYLYLSYKGARVLTAGSAAAGSAQQQADTVLDLPGGQWILGIAALLLAAAGAAQLMSAAKCSFLRHLDDRAKAPLVRWLGRVGYAARGLLFLTIAGLLGRAALDGRSNEAGGMEQALDLFSGPLLYAMASGLMLFGTFSILEAVYRRIHAPTGDELKDKVANAIAP